MSHLPPNGPVPPHYYGYPAAAAPPAGTYGYVPTPILMPMPIYPPPNPMPGPPAPETYVTNNYIYGQPPQPTPQPYPYPPMPHPHDQVMVANNSYNEDEIEWIPATTSTAPHYSSRAVKAGHEGWDGSPLWVIRARYSGELVPGKFAMKHRVAYIPHGGLEVPVHNFEILCAKPGSVRWLPASNGQVNSHMSPIVGGNSDTSEPLYVGRVRHMLSMTPGKIHPSHGCCYISFGGREIAHKHYEVLCKTV